MGQEYEIIGYPKLRHIRIFIDEVRYRSQHLHAEYECCFGLKGKAVFQTLSKKVGIGEGEIVFFDSDEVHSINTEEGSFTGLFVQISNHFLREYVPEIHTMSYQSMNLTHVLDPAENKMFFQKTLDMASSYFQQQDSYKLKTIAYALELFDLIKRKVPNVHLAQKDLDSRKKNAKRLSRITGYIDQNLDAKLGLSEIAESEGITPCHLSHLFSHNLGITFQDYINNRRLERAVSLIRIPQKRIIDIAYEAGFSDPKYMTNMFKKRFHCTPNEFRSQNIPVSVESSPLDRDILEHIFTDEEAIKFLSSYSVASK